MITETLSRLGWLLANIFFSEEAQSVEDLIRRMKKRDRRFRVTVITNFIHSDKLECFYYFTAKAHPVDNNCRDIILSRWLYEEIPPSEIDPEKCFRVAKTKQSAAEAIRKITSKIKEALPGTEVTSDH